MIFIASSHTSTAPPLWALDEIDGSTIWTSNISSSIALPTVDPTGTYLFVASDLNCISALLTDTGDSAWQSCPGGLVSTSPVVTTGGDAVIVTAFLEYGPTIFAYDISTGDELWSVDVGAPAGGSPALSPDGSLVYFCTHGEGNSGVVAVNINTTDVSWNWTAPNRGFNHVLKTPAVGPDGQVFVNGDDGFVYALDGIEGTINWQTGGLQFGSSQQQSSPAVSADGTTVYVGLGIQVVALDASTGKSVWNFTTEANVRSSPALDSNSTVYVGSDDGNVYALDANTGALVWSYYTGDSIASSPAISSQGTLVVATEKGYLYAFNDNGSACATSNVKAK